MLETISVSSDVVPTLSDASAPLVRSESASVRRTERLTLGSLCAAAVAMGILYVVCVRPGHPYDEPSHFSVIKTYARWQGLPIVGEPGVGYEAYQSPLYYLINSLTYRISAYGGDQFAFYVLRFSGLILLPIAVLLTYYTIRPITGQKSPIPLSVAAFVALNPNFVGMASSIQNDTLAIIFAMTTTWLCVRWMVPRQITSRRAAVLGLFVSLAALSKLTTAFLAGAVPAMLLMTYGRGSLRYIGVFLAVVAALTWWLLIRNYSLYGDITAGAAMQKYFPEGTAPKFKPWSLDDWSWILRSIITYCWIPVEYYRNTVKAGVIIRVIVLGLTSLAVVGWLIRGMKRRSDPVPDDNVRGAALLAVELGLGLGLYLYSGATQWVVPARFLLPCLGILGAAICGGNVFALRRFAPGIERLFPFVLLTSLLVMNAMILWSAAQDRVRVFTLFV